MKKSLVFLVVFVVSCIDNSPIIERDSSTEETYVAEIVFMEDFNDYGEKQQPNNFNFGSYGENKNTWINGAISEIEEQTKVMKLAMVPENAAGPYMGPNFESKELYLFGRYSARIKIPSVQNQPNVGGVVGFFTYYSDLYNDEQEKDMNKNKISDNSEIDFEWLIANPQLVY